MIMTSAPKCVNELFDNLAEDISQKTFTPDKSRIALT